MLDDERNHHFGRRSSSAWARHATPCEDFVRGAHLAHLALALFQPLALARRQAGPARVALHASPACSRSSRRATRSQPTATRASPVARTARSRISAGYLLCRPIAPIRSRLGATGKSGAVHCQRCLRFVVLISAVPVLELFAGGWMSSRDVVQARTSLTLLRTCQRSM